MAFPLHNLLQYKLMFSFVNIEREGFILQNIEELHTLIHMAE